MSEPVLEIADLRIAETMTQEFLDGVTASLPTFRAAAGFRSLTLRRSVEEPDRFRLMIEWDRLEDHTETFRNSAGFQTWRANVGHCFAAPPAVDHSVTVVDL